MKLKGRVALITGAGRNIGRAIALAIAREGGDLVLNTRKSQEALFALVKEVRNLGVKVQPIIADISDSEAVIEMVKQAEAEFGKVDILINNAVQRVDGSFLEMTLGQWNTAISINLTGPFNCAKAVIPGMVRNRWGRIINFSGIAANLGIARRAAMCTVKAGIVGFTKSLARELGPSGITVNSIAPGAIDVIRDSDYQGKGQLPKVIEMAAIKRYGQPEEIASLCVYLCTEEAGYITGQNICVNGGAYM